MPSVSSGNVFPALSVPDNVALTEPAFTTIWLFSRDTFASVSTPSTCTAVCPASTLPAEGGPTVVVVTRGATVVVVTTALDFAEAIVVDVVDGTGRPLAPSTGSVVVVGATVTTDA